MSWLMLTFLALLSRAIYGVLTKVTSSANSKIHFATNSFALTSANAVLILAISPLLGGIEFSSNLLNTNFFIAASSALIGNLIYFLAIKNLNSSNAQIIFSSILVFNTVLGVIILGQKITAFNLLGILLLSFAIILACYVREKIDSKAASLMILAAACFAVMQIFTAKVANSITAASYGFYSSVFFSVGAFLFYPRNILADRKHFDKKYLRTVLLTGLFSSANVVFAFYAYKYALEPTKVAQLFTSQVIFAVIISAIFLKERRNLIKKIAAAILTTLAALLIIG